MTVDTMQLDALVDLFLPEAVFDPGPGGVPVMNNRDEIRDFFQTLFEDATLSVLVDEVFELQHTGFQDPDSFLVMTLHHFHQLRCSTRMGALSRLEIQSVLGAARGNEHAVNAAHHHWQRSGSLHAVRRRGRHRAHEKRSRG